MPVYHVTFMDQLLRLLRARCEHCSRLKLRRLDINFFVCKLQLIQHGLLAEAQELENIKVKAKGPSSSQTDPTAAEVDGCLSSDDDTDPDHVMELRNNLVKRAIRKARQQSSSTGDGYKIEAILNERRAIVKQFLVNIVLPKDCKSCGL